MMVMVSTTGEEPTGSAVLESSPSVAVNNVLTRLKLRFLAAASDGDLEGLKSLLSRIGDVEEGNNVAAPSASAASIMEAATVEGDTALHLLAANGANKETEEIASCAKFIHEKDKDKSLLCLKNNKGETPLHCAAKSGKAQLISCLIRLAKDDGEVQDLLRKINNNKETALHEAIRRGDNEMVKVLLRADPELAFYPRDGTSPLYLAIQLIDDIAILRKEDKQAWEEGGDVHLRNNEEKSMAQTLHDESKDGFLSYLGPKGQNALHPAVLRGPVLTRKLLRWNKDLTIQRDEKGSTPLHFAAGLPGGRECSVLLKANPDALYLLDNDGSSPIHVAASVGAFRCITLFLKKCPVSAGFRDAKGRTFLHVAVEMKQVRTVYRACRDRSLAWIMNMQDNDGNTALHLAVRAGTVIFSALFANRKVDLNITNSEGQTPLDVAQYKVPPSGLHYNQNSEKRIVLSLSLAGARSGACRQDHFQENHEDIHGLKSEHESKEMEDMKDLTQTQSIVSVLIATVAFGATFALPGGYTNSGTPTLAGRYAFDAFMMANTLAFVFSAAATICLVRGGSPIFNRRSRTIHLSISFTLLQLSVTCFITAFALGLFVVLSPVAPKTAIAICAMSPLVVLCNNAEFWLRWLLLVPSYCVRKGPLWTSCLYIIIAVENTLCEFWPLLLIFIWAANGRTHPSSQVEPAAQPPSV